ncbi:MAG: SPOR domain-containing protein [Alloprevotella sp.]|nr:SPOR domain-containing protein [Alloprevotella sp.]
MTHVFSITPSLLFYKKMVHGLCSFTRGIVPCGISGFVACCVLMIGLSATATAQTFTKKVQVPHANGGKLTIIEKGKVDTIIDNIPQTQPKQVPAEKKQPANESQDTTKLKESLSEDQTPEDNVTTRQAIDVFRIQIYTGGNSRQSKQRAEQIRQQCKSAFPELNVYVRFISPHWVCRVGNFRTRQTAQRYAQQIKNKKISYETRILSSKIYKKQ